MRYLLIILSKLPQTIVTILAKVLGFFLSYIFKYRNLVIKRNLKFAFPNRTQNHLRKIQTRFYFLFAKNWLEALQLHNFTAAQVNNICTADYTLLRHYNDKGMGCCLWLSHQFNWEVANAHLSIHNNFKNVIVYRAISNIVVNDFFKKVRTRFGSYIVEDKQLGKFLANHKLEKFNLIMVGDQNPPNPVGAIWFQFFGTFAPFHKGMAVIAQKLQMPVLAVQITQTNKYHIAFELISEIPYLL
jgi:Kdo2-lipid IVA lauroyltransferase/acyltransferase